MTTTDLVPWSWGGHVGWMHPLAFVTAVWRMEWCGDGFLRPQVCDCSAAHPCTDGDGLGAGVIKPPPPSAGQRPLCGTAPVSSHGLESKAIRDAGTSVRQPPTDATRRHVEFDRGYEDGYNGKGYQPTSRSYIEGYESGELEAARRLY